MTVPIWGPADLEGAEARFLGLEGSPTKVIKVFSPPKREGKVQMVSAETAEAAADLLADKILAEKII
jgi:electron transfer flavoprotein alpha/beta subunit